MKHGEYERRKRAIEEQLQADLELVRAGYQAKLRALEFLWLASPGEERQDAPRETLASAETQGSLETLAFPGTPGSVETPEPVESPSAAPIPEAAPAPPAPTSRVPRRGDVLAEILETFPAFRKSSTRRTSCASSATSRAGPRSIAPGGIS